MSKTNVLIILMMLCMAICHLTAQKMQTVTIRDIIIEGNHKTKEKVIQRELNFSEGTTLEMINLAQTFDQNRLQIISTGLFNNVTLNLSDYNPDEKTTDIKVTVEENWYFFPAPIFELADRNFTVWWKEQDRSLSRVNYGGKISHYNFTGNRDPLRLKVHFGYTRKYELQYAIPYLALDNKLGIGANIIYSENREIAFQTIGNKTLFGSHEDDRRLLSRFRVGPEIKYRPTLNSFHGLRIEFHHNRIDPYVAEELNPNYFLDGRTELRFFFIEYDYIYDKRLNPSYPLGGYSFFGNIKKEGLGIFNEYDNLALTLGIEQHTQLADKLTISHRLKGKTNLNRNTVSFANNTGLGWNADIVSGYELYVMDGTDFFIAMNSLKYQILDNNLNTMSWLPRQFRKVNMSMFLRFNFDFAYVNERTYAESNFLNNTWIYGLGPAVDIILFNNLLLSFEYSYNDIGEHGLFFSNSIFF